MTDRHTQNHFHEHRLFEKNNSDAVMFIPYLYVICRMLILENQAATTTFVETVVLALNSTKCNPTVTIYRNMFDTSFIYKSECRYHEELGEIQIATSNYRTSPIFNLQLQNRITQAIQLLIPGKFGPWVDSKVVLYFLEKIKNSNQL